MRSSWPATTPFTQRVLTVEQDACATCNRPLAICDHRFHRIFTFAGPLEIVCKLAHCPDRRCPARSHTLSPLAEYQLTLPWWTIGWDVCCWLGQRRFARHWSIPQLRDELKEAHGIPLSPDAIARYLRHYQTFVAARQQDAARLAAAYRDHADLILTIDGLQPEKGHETLYVVRELRAKRVWFAEALLSSTAEEVRRLLVQAKQWAKQLDKPVALWMSDKQDAFVSGSAAEFPDVPHRYCQNHFLRDVAKPLLAADSHAKVQMRSKVRGLRSIEQAVLQQSRVVLLPEAPVTAATPELPVAPALPAADATPETLPDATPNAPPVTLLDAPPDTPVPPVQDTPATVVIDSMGTVVLDYCAAVRGILNDDQGGPLTPPGLRMAAGLTEVRASLQRNLVAKKGGAVSST